MITCLSLMVMGRTGKWPVVGSPDGVFGLRNILCNVLVIQMSLSPSPPSSCHITTHFIDLPYIPALQISMSFFSPASFYTFILKISIRLSGI